MSSITSLATPKAWWDELNDEFHFTIDLAASDEHHMTEAYFTEKDNALEQGWEGTGWLSPPWAEDTLPLWVAKALNSSILGSTIVMLLPQRKDAIWWKMLNHHTDEIRDVELDFIPMHGDKDRQFIVEPHCLWIFKGKAIMDEKIESEVLEERVNEINQAFVTQFPMIEWSYIVETHEVDEFVIAEVNSDFFKVGYSYNDDIGYAFSDTEQWQPVDRETSWVDKVKAQKELEFQLDACPKKMIKVIKSDEGSLVIGAYATIWGELDCDGERMQKEALQPYVDSNATPYMFWLHGWDNAFGSTIVGEWDKTTFTIDDVGLYVEGTITHPEAVRRLKESGEFGLSVGSNPKFVQVDGLGNITDWALLEISIMEGGKQCVPNARAEVDKVDNLYEKLLATKAAEFGEQEAPEPIVERYLLIGGELIRAN